MFAVNSTVPRAPRHLRAATRAWFQSIAEDYALEPHHTRLLVLAGEAWDRGQSAREVLTKRGLTYRDSRGNPRPRPENAIARDCAVVFARLIRELRLDVGAPDEHERPPRLPENGHRRGNG